MGESRFEQAIERIDAANADDPNTLTVNGERRPKELTHARMLTDWVTRLRPDASEELLLAARAHHIRRWAIARDTFPAGRRGYLRWRTALHGLHAEEIGEILSDVGYAPETVARAQQLVRKQNLRRDAEVQTLEDGLCLVFLETQLHGMRDQYADEKLIDVLRKTWAKMSEAGRRLALELDLSPQARDLVLLAIKGTPDPGDAAQTGEN